jgi:hypothetical protein
VKREARQNYYRQMHTAAREIYEAGQMDELARVIQYLKDYEYWCNCGCGDDRINWEELLGDAK